MAAVGESDTVVGAGQRRCGSRRQKGRLACDWQEARIVVDGNRESWSGAQDRKDKSEIGARPIGMTQLLSLSLAVNLIYGQTAVVRDSWFGVDKIKHFFMSAFIESVSYSALQAARANHHSAMAGAIGITLGFGVAREIHDMRTPGNIFSLRDLTWDAIGTGAGAALLSHTIR